MTRLALLLMLAPLAASAQTRPTDLIAADLGIEEAQFVACFADVRPDPGHAPSGPRQRANKAVLLPCLQAANPAITNAALDRVMDRYRPEGPMRK
ncbi:hypothetical protein SAMN06297129_2576 [Pseudooceanicola antarcticus]|uniref:Uncharacterized protein n=1 Tax=Pseudooceanicola antarcticus TaxID=1247613 RepID=A0A285IZH1_9RHOB|nr:hypothetical protein [Pseudooceanicola antarcticus]PJE25652.1 hypothetical protein CVM39_18215 [Pseudooceanicola antarcticus]SNY53372.1 hypothetical protein SAMN06297129_2576 [Pseudooceanicola antarcticus]